jgi:hypothetical protein
MAVRRDGGTAGRREDRLKPALSLPRAQRNGPFYCRRNNDLKIASLALWRLARNDLMD